jgi:FKBP-type peptidyl-prolyl cis-trans isomerase
MHILKKSVIGLSFLAIIGFGSCSSDSSSSSYSEDENRILACYFKLHPEWGADTVLKDGIYFKSLKEGTGDYVRYNSDTIDYVDVRYTGYLLDSTFFVTSSAKLASKVGLSPICSTDTTVRLWMYSQSGLDYEWSTGFKKALLKMREGGKAHVIIPSTYGYGSSGSGSVSAYTSMIFDIELVKVHHNLPAYDSLSLDTLLKKKNLTWADTLDGGVFRILTNKGKQDDVIADDDTVVIKYSMRFLNHTDIAQKTDSFGYIVGDDDSYVAGWISGFADAKMGMKGTLIIPNGVAYGGDGNIDDNGYLGVPPYTTLIYDFEVLRINPITYWTSLKKKK